MFEIEYSMGSLMLYEQGEPGRRGFSPGIIKSLQLSPTFKPLLAALGLTTISNGVDVSKWQEYMTWTTTRDAGAIFAYMKMTQGNVIKDSDAIENMRNSKGVIKLRGGYHFLNSTPSGSAQADYMINFMRDEVGDFGELPICLDVEIACDASLVKSFCYRVLERMGYFPLIYTSVGKWGQITGVKSWAVNCPLYVAHWYVTNPSIPAPWTTWVLHQWTNKGVGSQWGADSTYIDLDRGKDEWLDRYLPPPLPPAIVPLKQVVVTATDAPLVSQPDSPEGVKIGAVKLGDTLPVVETYGDWQRVEAWMLREDTT